MVPIEINMFMYDEFRLYTHPSFTSIHRVIVRFIFYPPIIQFPNLVQNLESNEDISRA